MPRPLSTEVALASHSGTTAVDRSITTKEMRRISFAVWAMEAWAKR
jgi:hypothetical protein